MLDEKATICPRCGLAEPAIQIKSFKEEIRDVIIEFIPFITILSGAYGLLHLKQITNISAMFIILCFVSGAGLLGMAAGFLFMINWQRPCILLLRVATCLAFISAFLILVL